MAERSKGGAKGTRNGRSRTAGRRGRGGEAEHKRTPGAPRSQPGPPAREITLLHAADVHLDSTFAQVRAGSEIGQKLRAATRQAFKDLLEIARRKRVDALLIAGDLYDHEYVTPDTGAFLVESLASLGEVPVLISPGNHDPLLPDSLYARLDWPSNVHIFTRRQPSTIILEEKGLCVHGFAHQEFGCRDHLFEGFSTLEEVPDGLVRVVLAHGSDMSKVPPDKETCAPFKPTDLAAVEGIHYWALGHYHRMGPVETEPTTTAYYSGCIQGRNFGETGPRHVLMVHIGREGVRVEPIVVSRLTLESAEIDVGRFSNSEALVEHVRRLCEAPAWRKAVARFVLVGEAQPTLEIRPKALTEELADRFAHVTFLDRTHPALDPGQVAEERTGRGEFARRMLEMIETCQDETEREDLRLALRLGLAAYEGREVAFE